MAKYIHRFNKTLTCEVEVTDDAPAKGSSHVLSFTWSHKPKKKHYAEYTQWMHTVNDSCAKRWGNRFIYAVQISPNPDDWQFWGYSHNQPPKRLNTVEYSDSNN